MIAQCIARCFVAQRSPTSDSKPAPSPSDALSALKSKLLEVKHRDPRSLLDVLKLLGSPAGSISANSDFHTITVRDLPENIALIEDAIRRLDTPEPARPDMEFRIHVLIASSAPSGQEELPADLRDVVKQLQETLRYKSYAVMASAIHRTKEGGQGVYNKGVAESKLFSITEITSLSCARLDCAPLPGRNRTQ